MSLNTRSKFYYDFLLTNSAYEIPFDEGSGEIIAQMNVLAYTPTGLATEIARAMTAAGDEDYSCAFDREERKFTITCITGTFSLLGASGTAVAPALVYLGFETVDTAAQATHTSVNATGKVYRPQFLLQDYNRFEDWEEAAYGTRRETAEGDIEDIRFGDKSFSEMNIKYITDLYQPYNSPIENNPTGEEDAREFLRYITNSRPFEFMPDRNDVNTFFEVILEKSQSDRTGQGYRLYENRDNPNYKETKKLTLRKI